MTIWLISIHNLPAQKFHATCDNKRNLACFLDTGTILDVIVYVIECTEHPLNRCWRWWWCSQSFSYCQPLERLFHSHMKHTWTTFCHPLSLLQNVAKQYLVVYHLVDQNKMNYCCTQVTSRYSFVMNVSGFDTKWNVWLLVCRRSFTLVDFNSTSPLLEIIGKQTASCLFLTPLFYLEIGHAFNG